VFLNSLHFIPYSQDRQEGEVVLNDKRFGGAMPNPDGAVIFPMDFERNSPNWVNFLGGFLNLRFNALPDKRLNLRPKSYDFYSLLSAPPNLFYSF